MTLPLNDPLFAALDAWIAEHFDDEVAFLQALVRVPTDTPPGDNAPHAERTAELLAQFGYQAERHAVPADAVRAAGLQSITNLIVRRPQGAGAGGVGPTIALNAHGDVVPPGDGWTHPPYAAEIVDGALYGRAAAVSKSDFATYTFATRALEAVAAAQAARGLALRGTVELHFTYDEEFGGELGPGWLLAQGLTRPDLLLAAGFGHEVITAHNGCLQLAVTVHGVMAHAAIPHTGVDALQGANAILNALYAQNTVLRQRSSQVAGITHPYLNVGRIEGGTNTNVVPGQVLLKLDRRMIPEEDPVAVEAALRQLISEAAATVPGITVRIDRLLLAHAMQPLPGNRPLVAALQRHGQAVLGEPLAERGTPLYTDARLYAERGIPAVIYGAGPRSVRESNAKRADEHLQLSDLQAATRVVARMLADLLIA
ncbi:M20/M25/M40 family metallo-hydrolase [Aquabacterium sp. OR-4]|uniref:M20/M25/M40 family metallo-hydrolase n=1 Tax=Aquabacterium sp. OR-4 TaxID=2978127 RepID=UPI0021B3EBFA|nr:M20/M25/M40 family metallo-hydrolase [Aquabacterium sp. OR-4]MDT7838275.1 M20/M25/M40 family metallo-hydrolase [Aquabacterium sp. OR-4]